MPKSVTELTGVSAELRHRLIPEHASNHYVCTVAWRTLLYPAPVSPGYTAFGLDELLLMTEPRGWESLGALRLFIEDVMDLQVEISGGGSRIAWMRLNFQFNDVKLCALSIDYVILSYMVYGYLKWKLTRMILLDKLGWFFPSVYCLLLLLLQSSTYICGKNDHFFPSFCGIWGLK